MITCTRVFEFDSAHRVLGHTGQCRFLHGHRYRAEVSVGAPKLNQLCMIIDFAEVKSKVGSLIQRLWDHNILLNPKDPLAELWETRVDLRETVFAGKAPYIMPANWPNPTAENLAVILQDLAEAVLAPDFKVTHVRVWETPNCYVDATT